LRSAEKVLTDECLPMEVTEVYLQPIITSLSELPANIVAADVAIDGQRTVNSRSGIGWPLRMDLSCFDSFVSV
jgi:hypothetical protein